MDMEAESSAQDEDEYYEASLLSSPVTPNRRSQQGQIGPGGAKQWANKDTDK